MGHRFRRRNRREALFGIVVVEFEMGGDEAIEQGGMIGNERALLFQNVREGPTLFEDPCIHSRNQGIARDEIHLHGEDAEE